MYFFGFSVSEGAEAEVSVVWVRHQLQKVRRTGRSLETHLSSEARW